MNADELTADMYHEATFRQTDGLRPYAELLLELREALQLLRDFQNGCPLPSYEQGWAQAMADSARALSKADALLGGEK